KGTELGFPRMRHLRTGMEGMERFPRLKEQRHRDRAAVPVLPGLASCETPSSSLVVDSDPVAALGLCSCLYSQVHRSPFVACNRGGRVETWSEQPDPSS